jgi:hypothetical protein
MINYLLQLNLKVLLKLLSLLLYATQSRMLVDEGAFAFNARLYPLFKEILSNYAR